MASKKNRLIKGLLWPVLMSVVLIAGEALAKEYDIKGSIKIPGQDTVQILTMKDGSRIIGRILSIQDNDITFESDLGQTTIQLAKIKEIKEVPAGSIRKGNYWFENPNATRLYFAATGRMLEKGQGYFSDYYLFFPGIAYGITDNFTFGAGMSIFPGVDIADQIFYFTPKIGLSATKNTNFALGTLIIALPEIDDKRHTLGILYAVGTQGSPDASLSLGLGYGYVDDNFADRPMVMVGGEKRFARRISFVSENWIIPGVDAPFISYGMRFFGEGLSVDLALFNLLDNAIFPGVPWIDFVFSF